MAPQEDWWVGGPVPSGPVDTAELADEAVTTGKIEDLAVTAEKLAADAVTNAKILDGTIGVAKLADGVVAAAVLALATGASIVADHEDDAALELLAADEDVDRVVLVIAVCTQALGGGTPATMSVGQTGAAEKFLTEAQMGAASPGEVLIGAGVLSEDADMIVTVTDGATTPTGTFTISTLVFPLAMAPTP